MKSTNVRQIKKAINIQTMSGRCQVYVLVRKRITDIQIVHGQLKEKELYVRDRQRIIDAKTVHGQLKVKPLNGNGQWIDVDTVEIDY